MILLVPSSNAEIPCFEASFSVSPGLIRDPTATSTEYEEDSDCFNSETDSESVTGDVMFLVSFVVGAKYCRWSLENTEYIYRRGHKRGMEIGRSLVSGKDGSFLVKGASAIKLKPI